MKLAIIGSGNVGKGLAGAAVKAGHEVILTSRNPEHYAEAAKSVGAKSAPVDKAVAGADVVVLAVPFTAAESVAAEIAPNAAGKVVIDPTNRFDPKDPAATLDGSSVAEKLQSKLPDAKVVKALNTVLAGNYANPKKNGDALDGYVAGDDESAKKKVLDLLGSIGFRPVDAGGLAMGRVLEGMALMNISLNMRNGWPWQSGFKLVGPTGN